MNGEDVNLTIEQQACNFHTLRHIERVRNLINAFVMELLKRGEDHDQSKLDSPEVEVLTEHMPKKASVPYGSKEYEDILKEMAPALEHHYARNRHHFEFYKQGIEDVTLVDLLEILCDWKASAEAQNSGNLLKSIEKNGVKYNISPQLVRILENTAKMYF